MYMPTVLLVSRVVMRASARLELYIDSSLCVLHSYRAPRERYVARSETVPANNVVLADASSWLSRNTISLYSLCLKRKRTVRTCNNKNGGICG